MATPGTGAWDLPHLDAGGCPVRFLRGLLGDPALADPPALVLVDEGVAAGQPELLERWREQGASPLVVPGGHAMRNGASAVARIAAAVGAAAADRLVAVGGAAMLRSVDDAVAASGRAVRHVRVPTTLHGLATALEGGAAQRADAVLVDFELLRSLSDDAWSAGIPIAIEAALAGDRAFFWWLERQTEELRHRSLPAMAWVMYRTAELCLAGPTERLGAALSGGGLRGGEGAAVAIALGATCSHQADRLPHLEWRRVLDLLDRLGLPVWHPYLGALDGPVACGLLDRIGGGVTPGTVDADAVLAAARILRDRARRTPADRPGGAPAP